MAKVRRSKGRPCTLAQEQVGAIQESIRGVVENSISIAAQYSHLAYDLTMALDNDVPNLLDRLKPIMALIKIMNTAWRIAVRLDPSILYLHAHVTAPPIESVVLVCLPPLARVG